MRLAGLLQPGSLDLYADLPGKCSAGTWTSAGRSGSGAAVTHGPGRARGARPEAPWQGVGGVWPPPGLDPAGGPRREGRS